MDELKLKEQIKESKFSNAYLFYGEEDYLKQFYANQLVKKCVTAGFEGFNLHKYDGESATIDEVISAAQVLPMMSEYSCVLVRDLNLASFVEDDRKKLEEFLTDLPVDSVTIFWMDAVKFNLKTDTKWRKIVDLFNKNAAAIDFEKKDKNYLTKTLISGANKRNKALSTANASYLVDIVGDDLNLLQNELMKLCAYCENEIDKEAIDIVATRSMSVKAFELTKAISSKNIERAFELLNIFFAQKTEPPEILGEIISAYVDMYRAKVAVTAGEKADYLANSFNYRNTAFRLTNGARDASKLSIEQLRKCLNELDKADESIKFSSADNRLALEELLIKLTLISNS